MMWTSTYGSLGLTGTTVSDLNLVSRPESASSPRFQRQPSVVSPDQITTWAASGESETLEFKRTTGELRDATRTLWAMLNHRVDACCLESTPIVASSAST